MSVFKNEPRILKHWAVVKKEIKCKAKERSFYVMLPHPITIEMTFNGEKVSFTVNCIVEDKKTGRMYWAEATPHDSDGPKIKWYDYVENEFFISPLSVISKHEPQKFWTEII